VAIDEEIRVCHQGNTDFGRPWVTAWGRGPRLDQWLERTLPNAGTATHAQLEAWRIEANRPWIDHEITDATGPLEIGLTDAIAGQKGCYPGQEVIEKIISLGAPAKRLALVELGSAAGDGFRAGAKLYNLAEPPIEVGELTTVDRLAPGLKALAIVRKIHAKEGLEVKLENGARGKLARISPYV
jgi:folate-binding protein YgfZ